MPRVVLDTTVLFAAAYRRDAAHRDGLAVLRGIDDGSLPKGAVLDYMLAETLNGLTTHTGHEWPSTSSTVSRRTPDCTSTRSPLTPSRPERHCSDRLLVVGLDLVADDGQFRIGHWSVLAAPVKNGIAPGGGTEGQPDSP